MNPSKPVLRNQPGDIKKWLESFDLETQRTAKKIAQMLGEQKYGN